MTEHMTAEAAAFSFLFPDVWAAEKKSERTSGIKSALKCLLQTIKIPGIPADALALVQQAILSLQEAGEAATPKVGAGEPEGIREQIAAIARRQTDLDVKITRREAQLRDFIAARSEPLPTVGELNAKMVKKAMRRVDADVRGDEENSVTRYLRHRFEKEVKRGKRR